MKKTMPEGKREEKSRGTTEETLEIVGDGQEAKAEGGRVGLESRGQLFRDRRGLVKGTIPLAHARR